PAGRVDERRPLQEVAGGIAAQGQLRENQEVDPRPLRPAERLVDEREVPGEIPNGGVDLAKGDAHAPDCSARGTGRGPGRGARLGKLSMSQTASVLPSPPEAATPNPTGLALIEALQRPGEIPRPERV